MFKINKLIKTVYPLSDIFCLFIGLDISFLLMILYPAVNKLFVKLYFIT